jgi:glucose/arabinose dehydrogenase
VPQARTTSAEPVRFATALVVALVLGACLGEPEPSGVNTAPSASIAAPPASATFKGGDSIAFAGTATDTEDGDEPGSRLTWWVVLHHDTHTHPFMPRTTGSSGKVFVPPIGETSDNVFLRLYLEAIDESGAADTVTRDIQPQKSQFTLATDPAGLRVTLDGQPVAAPQTINGVVGMERELGVPEPQTLGATQYRFSSWSDGGAATHRFATPAVATTYTARFTPALNQLPTVAVTAPSAGASFTVNTTATITATAADADGTVSMMGFYDGAMLVGEDQSAPYTAEWTPSTTGAHALTARATDNQGGVTTSATVNVTVNPSANRPPTATLTSPAAGATLGYNTPVTLSATAADADGSVTKVGFYDGTTLLGEDTSSPYSRSWTPTTAGSHSLTARATDNQNAVGSSAAVSVTVNQPPTVSITAPANGATVVVNSTVTFSANAADPGGSVQRVRFYDGATQLGDDTSAPYSMNWVPTSTGTHTLTAVAVDNLNASTTSPPVSVTVASSGADTQAPTLALTSPAAQAQGLTGSPTFTVSAADNVAVTAVEYQVDGEPVGQASSSPWSFTLPLTSVYTTGVHVIRARARDAAGNQSGWSSARVTFGGNINYPAGFSRTVYANELASQGTAMAWSPDGRLFICEQSGSVRIVKNGVLLSTPFVTVPTTADGERGLLGIAFHPQFASNGRVYLYYTTASGGTHNRISRFTASGDVAQSGSETVLVDLPGLSSATNHNGGALHFGPDGKLYVAVGENATPSNAPSLTTVLGKLLRFNDDGSIPADNPFYGSTTLLNRSIWARGLRNPFTFAFEPGTGLMYINDVGQNSWEEINVGRAGANYGWPDTEGATPAAGIDAPLFTYGHTANPTLVTGMAIVGGAFYRPSSVMFPSAWVGDYFFGDYVAGWINRLDTSNGNGVYAFARLGNLTDIQVGPDGALYVLALTDGAHWGVLRYSR